MKKGFTLIELLVVMVVVGVVIAFFAIPLLWNWIVPAFAPAAPLVPMRWFATGGAILVLMIVGAVLKALMGNKKKGTC